MLVIDPNSYNSFLSKYNDISPTSVDPLGVQGRLVHAFGSDSCQQVWAGPLTGNRLAVVLWNRCSSAATISVGWDVLGIQSSISVSVRDLWERKEVARDAISSFGVLVHPHDCAMYVFTPQLGTHSAM